MDPNQKYDPKLFERASRPEEDQNEVLDTGLTFWRDAWIQFRRNKAALVGLIVIGLIILLAIFGPYFNSYGSDEQNMSRSNLPPKMPLLEKVSWLGMDGTDSRGVDQYEVKGIDENFWFGTDELGRDLWTRVWEGSRISLYIAFLAAGIDLIIGVIYGSVSAYYGGRVDNIMQRILEVLMGIPELILIILLIMLLQPGILSITLAMIITGWVGMARIVRGQVLKLKNQEFVLASRALGAKDNRLLLKHLIPNTMGPIIITTMFTVPVAIFTEAFLSFIGLGLQPPIASLGTLVNDGFKLLRIYPHLMVISSVVISLIMISFNIVGDGLRDALDPRMKR